SSQSRIVASSEVPVQRLAPEHSSDPQLQGEVTAKSEVPPEIVQASTAPLTFLKGKLTSVDCSATPAALVTIISGAKTWKMHIRDSNHVILIGADKFSCAWTSQQAAVKYPQKSAGGGAVASLELQ